MERCDRGTEEVGRIARQSRGSAAPPYSANAIARCRCSGPIGDAEAQPTMTGDGDHGIEFEFDDGVRMRDTQADGGPSVRFTREEFDAFVKGAVAGEFDVDEGGDRAEEG